jgi:glycosyltransferase involved in cell wall biosynthesis
MNVMNLDESVSVLIPCNKESKYLSLSIDSVMKQTFPSHWEIVLVYQDSEIFKHIDLPLNTILVKQNTSGLVNALNEGLKFCNYNFIARLDADDLMTTSRISSQLYEFRKRNNLVALGGQGILIDENGNEFGNISYPSGSSVVSWSLDFNCVLPHPGTTIRKDIFLRAGGYRNGYEHAEDYDLWVRLRKYGKIDNLNIPVVYYRRHSTQLTAFNLSKTLKVTASIMAVAGRGKGQGIFMYNHAREIEEVYPKLIEDYYKFLNLQRLGQIRELFKLTFSKKVLIQLLFKRIILRLYIIIKIISLGSNKKRF